MRKNLILFTLALVMAVLFSACARRDFIPTNYYVLEYFPHTEDPELKLEKPLDLNVYISDTRIPRMYSRRQIVLRSYGPRIQYSNTELWGSQLSSTIPTLISRRLSGYNLFRRTQREIILDRPEYELITELNRIEKYSSGQENKAQLSISFALVRTRDDQVMAEHSANREKILHEPGMDSFVQAINDIILKETDNFVRKVLHTYRQEDDPEREDTEDIARPDLEPIDFEDESLTGSGVLLLPALSRTDNEPYFIVYDQEGDEIATENMGTPVVLPKGVYEVHYGSGSERQMMVKTDVEIFPNYRTVIEPDWGTLTIDIVDENRNYAKVRYEIFDLESALSIGSEFPAEEEIGEQKKIWVLQPGLYKVTIHNHPFNTFRNFTTVYVEEDKHQELRIVVSIDEDGNLGNMVGAGMVEESDLAARMQRLNFSSAIHGNINVTSSNEADRDKQEMSIILNAQLDNRLVYDVHPFNYNMRNLIELGTTRGRDTDFRISADAFEIRNTMIYYFLRNIGLYTRLDMITHMFSEYSYYSDNINMRKYDLDGNLVSEKHDVGRVKLKPSFFPINLKEGAGINIRLLNLPKANLNLRTGFGMRQDIARDVYSYDTDEIDPDTNIEYRVFREQKSEYREGTEISVVGSFQLPYDLTYSTNADILLPFDTDEDITFEWENVFNLKLFRYVSLDYRLRLRNRITDVGSEYIVSEHALFLRLSYFLR